VKRVRKNKFFKSYVVNIFWLLVFSAMMLHIYFSRQDDQTQETLNVQVKKQLTATEKKAKKAERKMIAELRHSFTVYAKSVKQDPLTACIGYMAKEADVCLIIFEGGN
jgi:hypothetical protein